jgi:outer membrane immunogenic protein
VNGSTAAPRAWQSGWTVGGGVDYLLAPNWIAGVDFSYYNFSFDRSAVASSGGTAFWSNSNADVYAVTGRISYKFGGL